METNKLAKTIESYCETSSRFKEKLKDKNISSARRNEYELVIAILKTEMIQEILEWSM